MLVANGLYWTGLHLSGFHMESLNGGAADHTNRLFAQHAKPMWVCSDWQSNAVFYILPKFDSQ